MGTVDVADLVVFIVGIFARATAIGVAMSIDAENEGTVTRDGTIAGIVTILVQSVIVTKRPKSMKRITHSPRQTFAGGYLLFQGQTFWMKLVLGYVFH